MIQYPSGKARKNKQRLPTSTSNRGNALEEDINLSNQYYLAHDIAVVHKKPTPIQVVKVDYPSRNKAKITEAYYRRASTTDYNGIYNGRYLDFEAKETKNKTSFPLSSIHEHQIKHLESVIRHGAIAFFIIRFTTLDETYLVYAQDVIHFIKNHTRKSIPHKWFQKHGHMLEMSYQIPCNYLEVIKLNEEKL